MYHWKLLLLDIDLGGATAFDLLAELVTKVSVQDWIATYEKAAKIAREEHVPVLVHVEEVTQPQGHSTSGSHERYKSKERLQWEIDFDCVKKMREFIIQNALADDATLNAIEEGAKTAVRAAQKAAWADYLTPIKAEVAEVSALFDELSGSGRYYRRVG